MEWQGNKYSFLAVSQPPARRLGTHWRPCKGGHAPRPSWEVNATGQSCFHGSHHCVLVVSPGLPGQGQFSVLWLCVVSEPESRGPHLLIRKEASTVFRPSAPCLPPMQQRGLGCEPGLLGFSPSSSLGQQPLGTLGSCSWPVASC